MSWFRRTKTLSEGHFVSHAACLLRQGLDGTLEFHGYSMEEIMVYMTFLRSAQTELEAGPSSGLDPLDLLSGLRDRAHP